MREMSTSTQASGSQATQSRPDGAAHTAALTGTPLASLYSHAGMVAYQGDVTFEHAGSGGMSKFMKKAVALPAYSDVRDFSQPEGVELRELLGARSR